MFKVSALAMLLFFSTLSFAQAPEVGSVKKVSGNVTLTTADGTVQKLAADGKLHEGDTLTSEADAEALIKFADDSVMILRQNSTMTISQFRFEKKPEDTFGADLLRGSLRYVSGLMGKLQPKKVRFSSATATIGIRGTDFEFSIVEEGEKSRAGEYNYVYEGGTNMQIATGEAIDIDPEQTGFAPQNPEPGEPRLQLLKEKPAFLRGGGFDAMMLQISRPVPMIPRR